MDDDAATSPLFTYLRTQLPDLLERAVYEGWKVAVPKASSLRGAAISQALVESHLLRQTAIRDEWKTANGRTVLVVKDPNTGSVKLTTGRGFPAQGSSVDVLAEDLWYGPTSDQGLQLVSVSDALEKDNLSTFDSFAASTLEGAAGGLADTVYYQERTGQASAVPHQGVIAGGKSFEEIQWCMDDKDCLKFIDTIEGSGEPLLDLEKKLVEFSKTYIFARNYEDETANKLRKFALDFAQGTAAGYTDAAYKAALCHTINILESKIWTSLKDLYAAQDMRALSAMREKLRTKSSGGIGISEDFLDVDFGEPVKAFRALDNAKSPALKLFCLQGIQEKTVQAICEGRKQAAVTVFGSRSTKSSKTSHVIGMDELLPLFIYVVCQAGMEDLVTTFHFMKHFGFGIGASPSGDFLITLIESVVTNLLSPL